MSGSVARSNIIMQHINKAPVCTLALNITDFEKCKVQYDLDIKECYNGNRYMLIRPCEERALDAYTLCQKLVIRSLA